MSRQMGYFAEDSVRDFPELNKCPDCETFFADLNCPLCGRECPEEYRSGNRKPIKPQKRRRSSGNGRVRFIPWYHSAPLIIALLILQPIIGLVLLWSSDHGRGWKIAGTVLALLGAGGWIIGALLGGLFGMIFGFVQPGAPVETMTPMEYMEYCEAADPARLYGYPSEYWGSDVTLSVTVRDTLTKQSEFAGETYLTYYQCEASADGVRYTFYLRDCRSGASDVPLRTGEVVRVYGTVSDGSVLHLEDGSARHGVSVEMYYALYETVTS